MNKYQSTLLAQDATKEEIQKADLDLLGKINSVIDGMPSGSNTGLDAEVNILKAEIIPASDIGRLTEISGDGLSTQYLHDKSGNVIWTNNGLMAVDGYRGKGLLCNGSGYAVANSSVIGSSGTISIQFSASSVSSGILWTDSVIATSGNTLYLSSGSLYINHHYSSSSESALIYSINTNTLYSVVVQFISSTSLLVIVNNIEYPIIWTIPSVSPTNNLYIAVNTALNTFFNGTIYGLKISSRLWTRDECISWGNNIAGVESSNAVFALNTTTGEKIYTKIINGTTSSSVGGSVTVAHGLDITKILPFSGFIRYSTSQILPFGTRLTLTDDANCVSAYVTSSTLITITNTTGLAAVYRGAPFTILIPYML